MAQKISGHEPRPTESVFRRPLRKSGPLTKHQNESVLRSDEGISRTENLSSHAKLGRVWSDETLVYKYIR